MTKTKQVFISHATEDAEFAHRLADDLQRRGVQVWIAPDSIQPGEGWVSAIERGLQESSHMVVLLTPAALNSSWVKKETEVAITSEREGNMQVIPLDIEKCAVPPLLSSYQMIPFRQGYEGGLDRLSRLLGSPATPRKPSPTIVSATAGATVTPTPRASDIAARDDTPKKRKVREIVQVLKALKDKDPTFIIRSCASVGAIEVEHFSKEDCSTPNPRCLYGRPSLPGFYAYITLEHDRTALPALTRRGWEFKYSIPRMVTVFSKDRKTKTILEFSWAATTDLRVIANNLLEANSILGITPDDVTIQRLGSEPRMIF